MRSMADASRDTMWAKPALSLLQLVIGLLVEALVMINPWALND
jgi:hypothetical protein